MSTAEPRSAALARRRQSGYTFLEMAITIVIISLMSLVVERVLSSVQDSERYLGALRQATERGQKLAYEVRDIASTSRKLYADDAAGNSFLDALDLGSRALAPGCRLPSIDEVNPLGPDVAGTPLTGNVLLLVREADPAPCVANPATKKTRLIDTYRFVCVYPTVHARVVVNGRGQARDLVIWRSQAYPSRAQIQAITDATERSNVIKDLVLRFGHDFAWDPTGDADQTFFAISAAGALSGSAAANPTIEEDPEVSEGGRLVYANVQLAATEAGSHVRRAVLSRDDLVDWAPHGFEVKIVGSSASRKVWLHLVIEAQAGHGRSAITENTLIASTSDL